MVLTPVTFADLPGWASADLAPALTAFKRQCDSWRTMQPTAVLSGGMYGGPVANWMPACNTALTIAPGNEHWFFENYFDPQSVTGTGEAKLTAYYEPMIEVRRLPEFPYTEPLLKRPVDMVTVDLSAFAQAYDSEVLRGAPRALNGKLNGNRVEPYPKRDSIFPAPGQAFAYAHPADVYNLQVQGSGRIRFPDGSQGRAAFSAQNGYKWNSALGALRSAGRIPNATWGALRSFMDGNPAESHNALNVDPSYVFFAEEAIADYTAGPRGAANVNLTAQGSVAVDPAFHPYGAVVYVDGTYGGAAFNRLLVAQDTGGAIRRGPMRGDVFFGSGPEAGSAAEKMNGPARWWTLLPKSFATTPIAGLETKAAG